MQINASIEWAPITAGPWERRSRCTSGCSTAAWCGRSSQTRARREGTPSSTAVLDGFDGDMSVAQRLQSFGALLERPSNLHALCAWLLVRRLPLQGLEVSRVTQVPLHVMSMAQRGCSRSARCCSAPPTCTCSARGCWCATLLARLRVFWVEGFRG